MAGLFDGAEFGDKYKTRDGRCVKTSFNGLLLVHIKNTATGITSERDTTEPVKWDKVLLLALAIPTIGIIFNVVCSSIK